MYGWSRYARPRGPFCPFRDGWNDLSRLRSRFGTWRRVPRDGVLAGVCAGLADALHVQPLFVRLGFVAMGLMSGPFAVVAYIILAAALPADQAEIPPQARSQPKPEPAGAGATDFKAEDFRTAAAELAALRARLADCDRRTAELERKVVADNLDLDRAIRDLEK
jgi:phage shock protein C